jgi:hypothetical protein
VTESCGVFVRFRAPLLACAHEKISQTQQQALVAAAEQMQQQLMQQRATK